MIYNNILETIGRTPLVRINHLVTVEDADVIAKVEFFNPGGSIKDRIGLGMIEAAESRGLLKKGSGIVEPTSGNTGVGLAMAAAVKGYQAVFTMPASMSIERRALLKQYGAEIVLTPAEEGMGGAMEAAEKIAAERGYFMPQQFKNPANPETHRRTTAREIISDLGENKPDYFVAGVGTGGTISGVGEVMKEHYPDIRIIAVEPEGSPVLSGGKPGPHRIQGIGAGFIPDNVNQSIIDEVIKIENEDAFDTARELARQEGLLVGISAGANMAAAQKIAQSAGNGKLVVVILPDTGERYISTDLFQ